LRNLYFTTCRVTHFGASQSQLIPKFGGIIYYRKSWFCNQVKKRHQDVESSHLLRKIQSKFDCAFKFQNILQKKWNRKTKTFNSFFNQLSFLFNKKYCFVPDDEFGDQLSSFKKVLDPQFKFSLMRNHYFVAFWFLTLAFDGPKVFIWDQKTIWIT